MISINDVNEKLSKTWEIVGGNYNFMLPDFISDPTEDNVMVTFLKIRIATEAVCRYIVIYEGLVKESNIKDPRLSTYLEWLNRSFEIKDKVKDIYIPHIQKMCNGMVHYKDAPLTFEDAKSCTESFSKLLEWFVSNYSDAGNNELKDILLKGNMRGIIPDKVEGMFISREDDSKRLATILDTQGYACVVSAPGTGKTELCKDYVECYKSKYNRVYYVENPSSAMQFVYDVPFKVKNAQNISKDKLLEKKIEQFKLLNECEEKTLKKFLFILDNYEGNNKEDLDILRSILPEISGRVHIIITSTSPIANIDFMEPVNPCIEDCCDLFRQFNHKAISDEWIKNLIGVLRYNLRGIKMTASFLENHFDDVDLNEFIVQLQENLTPEMMYGQLCMVMLDEDEEMDSWKRRFLTLATLITPSGMKVDEFRESLEAVFKEEVECKEVGRILEELAQDGWFSIVNSVTLDEEVADNYIEISPIISETLFVKMCPDMNEDYIVRYIGRIVEKIKEARKLTESELEELKPQLDHITRRLIVGQCTDYLTLRMIRDYYIAAYDTEKIQVLTGRINQLAEEDREKRKNADISQATYREGIAHLNVEEFDAAASLLGENIKQNELKINALKSTIAMASAHCAHALARIGEFEKAIENGKRSVKLREELIKSGVEEQNSLWISYYNYALALFYAGDHKNALKICKKSIKLFPYIETDDKYVDKSSPLHLRGQIYMAMDNGSESYLNKAIKDLEDSRKLRAAKGNNTFWIAQLDVYLSEAFEKRGDLKRASGDIDALMDYTEAEKCAKAALSVKLKQFKTDNMLKQIAELEEIIKRIAMKKECMYESCNGGAKHTE